MSSKVSPGAVATCQDALESNLERRDLFQRYVELQRVRGQFSAIEAASRKVLEEDDSRADARYYLAFGLRKQGKYKLAIAEYQRYQTQNPEDPDVLYGMALCREARGEVQTAIGLYQQYVNRERRAEQKQWVDKAAEKVLRLAERRTPPVARPIARTPTPARPRLVPATSRPVSPTKTVVAAPTPSQTTSQTTGTAPATSASDCSVHEAAIKSNPFAISAYEAFVRCAQSKGLHAEIITKMRIAVRDNPEYARGFLHLGLAHRALGQSEPAAAALGEACKGGVAEACQP